MGQHDVACCAWLHGFSRHRDQASHRAITHVIPAPTTNFARNSPTTISNLEFRSLELQRFQTLLKLLPIELRATFLGARPTIHRHRDQASHRAITHVTPAPTPNFARNSPTTISNLEFRSLELQRFQTLLKLLPIELRATFLEASPATTAHGHRDQASATLPSAAQAYLGVIHRHFSARAVIHRAPILPGSRAVTRVASMSTDPPGVPTKE